MKLVRALLFLLSSFSMLLLGVGAQAQTYPTPQVAGIKIAGAASQSVMAFNGSNVAAAVTPTNWFDGAYCNTVGYLIVRFTGSWTCSQAIAANPVWWGADPTGTSYSDTALNNALAASVGNVQFPAGTFKFNGAISYTNPSANNVFSSIVVKGDGADKTILDWPNNNYGLILGANWGGFQSFHVRDLTFETEQANPGSGLTLISYNDCANQFNDVSDVTFRPKSNVIAGQYWTTGLELNGIGSVILTRDNFFGYTTTGSDGTGTGLFWHSSNGHVCAPLNVSDSVFNFEQTGIEYGSGEQGLAVTNTNFLAGTNGIHIATGVTPASQLSVINSQFGALTYSIRTESASDGVNLVNNFFISSPVALDQFASTVISSNIFSQGTYGLSIGHNAGTYQAAITGNYFIAQSSVAFKATDPTSQFSLVGNTFQSGSAISNSSTKTNNLISENPGYNPVGGSGITVGASPFVHTAGPTSETVYVSSGTVSSITVSGQFTGLTSGAFVLPPNKSISVTYSAAPNMNKYVN